MWFRKFFLRYLYMGLFIIYRAVKNGFWVGRGVVSFCIILFCKFIEDICREDYIYLFILEGCYKKNWYFVTFLLRFLFFGRFFFKF